MSDERDDEVSESGDQYDAPNQQVVREDGSGPADEGTGGQSDTEVSDAPSQQQSVSEPGDDTTE